MTDYLTRAIGDQVQSWDTLLGVARPAPHFTWSDWNEALLSLTTGPAQELLVRGALAATVKTTSNLDLIDLLHQLLMIAVRLHDPAVGLALTSSLEGKPMP